MQSDMCMLKQTNKIKRQSTTIRDFQNLLKTLYMYMQRQYYALVNNNQHIK